MRAASCGRGGELAAAPRPAQGPARGRGRGARDQRRSRTRPTRSPAARAGLFKRRSDRSAYRDPLKGIYEALEDAVDACETAANGSGTSSSRTRSRLAMTVTLVAVVVVALFFDFTNGFHDTANSIATSVSTGRPHRGMRSRWPRSSTSPEPSSRSRWPRRSPRGSSTRLDHARHHPRGPRRRDHLEPRHLVSRPALELEPRPDRRRDRIGDHRGGWSVVGGRASGGRS